MLAAPDYVNAEDLKVGQKFLEDNYPEVWLVVEAHIEYDGTKGCLAKCVGHINHEDTTSLGQILEFYGIPPYGPCLIRLS